MKPGRSVLTLIIWMLPVPALAEPGNVFTSSTTGFAVTKPPSWRFVTAEQSAENLKAIKPHDPEFHATMLKYATAPLVAMAKFPEPFTDVNPNFSVKVKPFGEHKGKAPTEILRLLLPQFDKAYRNLQVVQAPIDVRVSGIASGYARMNYSLEVPGGRLFPTTSEVWIVPRGEYFFLIGAGTRQDEATGSRREIQEILQSVKIQQ
jgi:hypothetical protein